jgi:hypothetical protein
MHKWIKQLFQNSTDSKWYYWDFELINFILIYFILLTKLHLQDQRNNIKMIPVSHAYMTAEHAQKQIKCHWLIYSEETIY